MIGLDTNVLVRYIVQDDPKQSQRANRLIEKAIANKEMIGISQITLCELIWVLETCYHTGKEKIIDVLKQLLGTQQICIEGESAVKIALQVFERCKSIDFSDCLIAHQNAANSCSFTYTFDKRAAKELPEMFKIT
jgi:predicted nucleic-acid-binding protein